MRVLTDGVLRSICQQGPLLALVFSGLCLGFLLSLVSAVVVDPNSATFVIVVLNIVGLAVLIAIFGYLIYRCRQLD